MARIEIIMYLALGFATAGLIALLLGRVMWNVAISIGRRRAQRTAPPAVAELQAERNQLRAEYAMLSRRLEARLDELKMQLAEHMAEVSRSRNRVDNLQGEITKRDAIVADRDAEIARLKEQLAGLQSELTARTESLHQLQEEHRRHEEAHAALNRDYEAVRSRERTVQDRLKERIEDLTALSQQIEAQRRELMAQQSRSQALRDRMAQQRQPQDGADAGDTAPTVESMPGETLPLEPVTSGEGHQPDAPLEQHIEDADRQASHLEKELERLDGLWAAKLNEVAHAVESEAAASDAVDDGHKPRPLPDPGEAKDGAAVNGRGDRQNTDTARDKTAEEAVPAEDGKKSSLGLANVISFAQRIRALQRNGS